MIRLHQHCFAHRPNLFYRTLTWSLGLFWILNLEFGWRRWSLDTCCTITYFLFLPLEDPSLLGHLDCQTDYSHSFVFSSSLMRVSILSTLHLFFYLSFVVCYAPVMYIIGRVQYTAVLQSNWRLRRFLEFLLFSTDGWTSKYGVAV